MDGHIYCPAHRGCSARRTCKVCIDWTLQMWLALSDRVAASAYRSERAKKLKEERLKSAEKREVELNVPQLVDLNVPLGMNVGFPIPHSGVTETQHCAAKVNVHQPTLSPHPDLEVRTSATPPPDTQVRTCPAPPLPEGPHPDDICPGEPRPEQLPGGPRPGGPRPGERRLTSSSAGRVRPRHWDEPLSPRLRTLSHKHSSVNRQTSRGSDNVRHREENFIQPRSTPQMKLFSLESVHSGQPSDIESDEYPYSRSQTASFQEDTGPNELEMAAFQAGEKSMTEALKLSQARVRLLEKERAVPAPLSQPPQMLHDPDQYRTDLWAKQQRQLYESFSTHPHVSRPERAIPDPLIKWQETKEDLLNKLIRVDANRPKSRHRSRSPIRPITSPKRDSRENLTGSVRTRSDFREIDSFRSKSPEPIVQADPKEESVFDIIQKAVPVALRLKIG